MFPGCLVYYITLLTIPLTVTAATTPQTKSSIPLLTSLVQPLASYINHLWQKRIEVKISRTKQQPIINRYKGGPIRANKRLTTVHYHDSLRTLSTNKGDKYRQGDANKDTDGSHKEEMDKLLGILLHTIQQIKKLEQSKLRQKSKMFEIRNPVSEVKTLVIEVKYPVMEVTYRII